MDDISVIESPSSSNPVQFISNGNFENGLTGWRVLGTHNRSRVEPEPGNPANHVLHVIATGPQEHMHNHIETTLINGLTVTDGREYQISFRARWLAGNNLLNTRLYFDRVARTTVLPVPALNGTPGAQNSCYATNLGPTFSQFQHNSVIPQPDEPVIVSVAAQDPQGVSCVQCVVVCQRRRVVQRVHGTAERADSIPARSPARRRERLFSSTFARLMGWARRQLIPRRGTNSGGALHGRRRPGQSEPGPQHPHHPDSRKHVASFTRSPMS